MFILDKNDTPLNEIITGSQSLPMVHGRLLERNFDVIHCDYCGKQILPQHVKCLDKDKDKYESGHNYRLISDSAFNQKVNCDNVCRNNGLKKNKASGYVRKNEKKSTKTISQQVKPWTPEQLKKVGKFIFNPSSQILRNSN